MTRESRTGPPARSPQVLCVDDDSLFLETVVPYFEQELPEAEVVTETSAGAGLDRLEGGAVECVVSDYDMPGTDGLEFLTAVREEYPEMPFILYTGKGSEEIASRAINAGVTGYLQKGGPEQHRRLIHRVDHAIEEYRAKVEAKRYSEVLKALDYPLYVVDSDGRFEYVNEAFLELTGYDREAVLGSEPSLIKDETGVERANDALRSVLSATGPDTEQFEVTIYPRDGDPIPCRDHLAAETRDGEFRASVGILRDLRNQHQTKRELRSQKERLEEVVAIVTHDLKTPLQTACSAADLARETGDDEYFETLATAHSRMDRMISELLTLASEGETVSRTERIDLASLVRDAWEDLETGRHELVVETGSAVEGTPDRVRRLVENLVQNALQHGDEPATVRVGDLESGDGFYVADDGPGIPPEERDVVFEPGYTTATEGTGFGLTIVERIANAHGWEIAITDSRHGGARFELADSDEASADASGPALTAIEPPSSP